MGTKRAVFLYDYTGIMAQPWLEAGYECWSFDAQHRYEHGTGEQHEKVTAKFDPKSKLEGAATVARKVRRADIVFGFPPCTDLAVSGARHFAAKRALNPMFQTEAAELADLVRCVGILLDCPWAFENPVSVLATQYRKPDFSFNPCDFGGYLPGDDAHPLYPGVYPPRDAYNKKTCIWHGNGFREPKRKRVDPVSADNPAWRMCGGKSLKTKNIRSATPRGFARAVFEANSAQSARVHHAPPSPTAPSARL